MDTNINLKKYRKKELIELVVDLSEAYEEQAAYIQQLQQQLAARPSLPRSAKVGSIAEAALHANGYFQATQRSADAYLREIKRLHAQMEQRVAQQAAQGEQVHAQQMQAQQAQMQQTQAQLAQAQEQLRQARERLQQSKAQLALAQERADQIVTQAKKEAAAITAQAQQQAQKTTAEANRVAHAARAQQQTQKTPAEANRVTHAARAQQQTQATQSSFPAGMTGEIIRRARHSRPAVEGTNA